MAQVEYRPEEPYVSRLAAHDVTLAYQGHPVAEHLDVAIPDGSFTAIIGPNACGKSTLLGALGRVLRPAQGTVHLDGRDITSLPARKVAQQLGLLPQGSTAPDGITVADLVARGRYPYQGLFRQWRRGTSRWSASRWPRPG